MSTLLDLQLRNPISINRLAELAELEINECETSIQGLLAEKRVEGRYLVDEQVFVPPVTFWHEETLLCQVGMEKFQKSAPHYTCSSCGRHICGRCVKRLTENGNDACPFCNTMFDRTTMIDTQRSLND